MFTTEYFLEKLPETYSEFVELCTKYFPFVADTKYLTEFCSGSGDEVC